MVELDNTTPVPEAYAADHARSYSAVLFDQYRALVSELIRRRMDLGLSQDDLDAAAGWADGYTAKAETLARIAKTPTL